MIGPVCHTVKTSAILGRRFLLEKRNNTSPDKCPTEQATYVVEASI